jgi:non-heme chloroperoxidase
MRAEIAERIRADRSLVDALRAGIRRIQPRSTTSVSLVRRGPLVIISGEKGNTVPWAIANASFKREQRNVGVTAIVEMPNRGHGLVVDSGWPEVADTALAFSKRFI